MSQAEELLNQLSEDFPIHAHSLADSDKYFIIDPVTRTITNPIGRPLTLMQRDHNSTIYTFQLPRYIDGHDMMLCNRVKCHFNNIENTDDEGGLIEHPDVVELTDLRVNPEDRESVICSCIITRQATWYAGALGFFLQYLCVDNAGNETYEWHTDSFTDIVIKKTEHNDEAAILEYTAIFEQWRERIFGAGDSVKSELIALTEQKVSEIETEGSAQVKAVTNEGLRVLDTIPEDYSAMSAHVDALTKVAGPVIRQEVEGEQIVVKDSAKTPLLGLQMFGKSSQITTNGYQLFDESKFETFALSGSTVTNNNDGSFAISGTGVISEAVVRTVKFTHEELVKIIKAGELYLDCGRITNPYFYAQIRVNNNYALSISNNIKELDHAMVTQEMLDDETSVMVLGFYGVANSDVIPGTIKPMLYQDGDGTWEPFSGGKASPNPEYPRDIVNVENPTVNIYGKNLVHPIAKARAVNGYLITPNADGTVTVSGASEAEVDTVIDLAILGESNGVYYYTNLKGGVTYSITCWKDGELFETPGTKQTLSDGTVLWGWTPTESQDRVINKLYRQLKPTVGDTSVCGTYAVQIEVGEIPTEYEPYVNVQELNASIEFPGIPVESGGNYTDENGQQYIANYRDWERGVDVEYILSIIFDGSDDESWINGSTGDGTNNRFQKMHRIDNLAYEVFNNAAHMAVNSVCNSFVYQKTNKIPSSNCFRISHSIESNDHRYWYFVFNPSTEIIALEDVEAWVAHLKQHPITVMVPLRDPIETPILEEELQVYRASHTNYPNTTILNDSGAYMKLVYGTDTKMYIDNKFEELKNAIVNNS